MNLCIEMVRNEDGTVHEISEADIRNIIRLAEGLVEHIETEWQKLSLGSDARSVTSRG